MRLPDTLVRMSLLGDTESHVEKRAQQISSERVDKELESISRMHNRTMLYISLYVTVIAATFTLLGFIGYEKLQQIVLDATLKNVQAQTLKRVNDRVDKQLHDLDVPAVISQKVQSFASTDLQKALTEQIEHGPAHEDIRRIAFAAASGVHSQAAQPNSTIPVAKTGRVLTDVQRRKLFDLVNEKHLLPPPLAPGQIEDRNTAYSRGLLIFVVPENMEALNYAQQIRSLLTSFGWDVDLIPDAFVATAADHRFAVGLHYVFNPVIRVSNMYLHRGHEAMGTMFLCMAQAGIPVQASEPADQRKDYGSFLAVGAQQ